MNPDRQRDSQLLPTEGKGIKTAKMLAKKAVRSGKMSYVTELILVISNQILDKSETRRVDYKLQSLKKAMANFQQSNDEYAAVL